ncbi:MAG: class I SAM-dependent methyltransferase [Steroidobacteraceae bacterium]
MIRKLLSGYRALKLASAAFATTARLPQLGTLDAYLQSFCPLAPALKDATALDIGCGPNPQNPFQAGRLFGLDVRENAEKNVKRADLAIEPIPYADATFDYVTAHDFLEHIPRVAYTPGMRFPFVELMNEIWRVLKPQGIFMSYTPIYPYAAAFRDPTHVNIMTDETFPLYFDNRSRLASAYGFRGAFEILGQALSPPQLVSVLRKDVV